MARARTWITPWTNGYFTILFKLLNWHCVIYLFQQCQNHTWNQQPPPTNPSRIGLPGWELNLRPNFLRTQTRSLHWWGLIGWGMSNTSTCPSLSLKHLGKLMKIPLRQSLEIWVMPIASHLLFTRTQVNLVWPLSSKLFQVFLKKFTLKWLCWKFFWPTLFGLRQPCQLGWLHSLPPSQSSLDKKLLKDLSTMQTLRTTWTKILLSI